MLWIKLLPTVLVAHMSTGSSPSCSTLIQLPPSGLGKQEDGSNVWAPAPEVADLKDIPDFRHASAIVAVRGMRQWMEDLVLL